MANIPDDELYHQYELLREQQYEPLPGDLPRVGGPVAGELPDIVTSFDDEAVDMAFAPNEGVEGEEGLPPIDRNFDEPSPQMDGPGTYPDQAIDPELAALEGLANSAAEFSAEPEAPAYTPAAELPEDTSPRSFQDLGDESVDELENAQAEVAGIAATLQELERDMGGTGEEESAPVKQVNPGLKDSNGSLSGMVSEESRWRERSGDSAPWTIAGNLFSRLRSAANPNFNADEAISNRMRRLRGDFDYERQLRNEGRNEAQEDEDRFVQNQDRARRVASEDEVLARRRTLQGREDEVYSQSQEERAEARTASSEPNTRYQQVVAGLLGEVGFTPEEAAEYTRDLRVGDTERQSVINNIVEMRNKNRLAEAKALARRELELFRRRGGRGNQTIAPGTAPAGSYPVEQSELDAWVARVEQAEGRRLSREPREDGTSEYVDMLNFARGQLQTLPPGAARQRVQANQMNTVANAPNRVRATSGAQADAQSGMFRGWRPRAGSPPLQGAALTEARNIHSSMSVMADNASRAIRLLDGATFDERTGNLVFPGNTEGMATLNNILNEMQGTIRLSQGWGAPQIGELAILERLLPTQGARSLVTLRNQIIGARNSLLSSGKTKLESAYGLERDR